MSSGSSRKTSLRAYAYRYLFIREWQSHIITPLETFADQDVLQVISDSREKEAAERKLQEAKRAVVRAAEQAANAEAEAAKAEAAAAKITAKEDANEEKKDEEETGGDSPAEAEGGADAEIETGPIHEGVACDGCKVSVLSIPAGLIMNARSRLAIQLSAIVSSAQSV